MSEANTLLTENQEDEAQTPHSATDIVDSAAHSEATANTEPASGVSEVPAAETAQLELFGSPDEAPPANAPESEVTQPAADAIAAVEPPNKEAVAEEAVASLVAQIKPTENRKTSATRKSAVEETLGEAAQLFANPEDVISGKAKAIPNEAIKIQQPPKPAAAPITSKPEAAATATGSACESDAPGKVVATTGKQATDVRKPAADDLLFRDLPLAHEVQLAVQASGYLAPTPVQAEIIPHVMAGRDVLAQSQTGTGKTAAFALPILSNLDLTGPRPQVLVLAPTRELATQVAASFGQYGSCMPKLRIAAIYGGADYEPQLRSLRKGVHVVVGTPGRVIDHIKRGALKLDNIKCLVLDEADEMLNMGFLEDVEFVLTKTPKDRQIALFSATMPKQIRRIADEYLNDPQVVTIQKKTLTADSIVQKCVFVEDRNKVELLARLLEYENTDGVIVFTKTKESTTIVAEKLARLGHQTAALNGDLPQARRQRAVDQLKSGALNVLVATDVAARGLDVQRISHVFNFDLPHDSESYVHRIGRTGRAGRTGTAVIFLTQRQRGKLHMIEKATRKTIEIIEPPTADDINKRRVEEFKKRIVQKSTATKKLAPYKQLIAECISETGLPPEIIAASLAAIAQGSTPLFVDDLPKITLRPTRERAGSRDRSERSDRPERRERRPRRSEAGMRRYRIEVGHTDGVKPGNIVGAIANEAGISGGDIGGIEIRDSYSFVDLPEKISAEALSQLTKTWVAGKQLGISPAGGNDAGEERRPNKYKSNNRDGAPRGKSYTKSPGSKSSGGNAPAGRAPGVKMPGGKTFGGNKGKKPWHPADGAGESQEAKPAGKKYRTKPGGKPAGKPYASKGKPGGFKGKPVGGKPKKRRNP